MKEKEEEERMKEKEEGEERMKEEEERMKEKEEEERMKEKKEEERMKEEEKEKEEGCKPFRMISEYITGINCTTSLCLIPTVAKQPQKSTGQGRLEGSGMITAHCSLEFPGSSDPPVLASRRWGFHYIVQVVLNFWPQAILPPKPPNALRLQM
ncbi:hypothetical protein AAY473_016873 [Plecturocebus cupreus]